MTFSLDDFISWEMQLHFTYFQNTRLPKQNLQTFRAKATTTKTNGINMIKDAKSAFTVNFRYVKLIFKMFFEIVLGPTQYLSWY